VELIRTRPDPRVEKWVYGQDEQALHLSVVSIGELRRGLVVLPLSNGEQSWSGGLKMTCCRGFKDAFYQSLNP